MIILTGGAGFIGSCFLAKLNEQGEKQVLVVDHDDSAQKMANLKGKDFLDFIEKEKFIKEVEKGKLSKDVKAIFHIGACSSTMETDAEYLRQNNLEYSKTLAKWSLDNSLPFFYASSAATYGDGEQGYSDQDSKIPNLKPLNLYGQSKQDFDLWLFEHQLTSKVVGFKYFNVYGPNEYHKEAMRSLVVKAYQQIKKDQKIRLFKSYKPEYKDGEQQRDFIYIKDATNLMWEFYQNQQVKGIYNIGTGRARTWNDLATAIFTALSLPVNIEYIEMPESIKDKYQYFTEADLTKLRGVGMRCELRELEAAVADYVQNYLEKDFAIL
ncbi:MAG: ADP-glyceromanno-heptose 6-epimerase [Candidatus Margulisbacteria bacterium]|nr:ADP-glyceromanno-heptose 6-epimerase [Candidatus Margulisiibacteriota bacterium]